MSALGRARLERAWGRQLLSRRGFDAMIEAALDAGRGLAAGKLGGSERSWLSYALTLERETDPRRLRALEIALAYRTLRHAGVFPTDATFLRRFSRSYVEDFRELDAIGLFGDAVGIELDIMRSHRPAGAPMNFVDQEPDRSSPANDAACWLRHLRSRRVLLVCPFADLLRDRADRETFEAVWAKTGKRWFEPADVASVELPYGYAAETWERYETAFELFDETRKRVDLHEFDVALIAAGGLGVPLAVHVKRAGRVGISLGGHLQVLFGVLGRRWLERSEWRRRYINESWVPMPARYVPDLTATGENYW
jgi:hypothetical protein